ncbi:pyridoxamine 5'-phosphate oxidase [Legionella taurinensis]|uniref:Pyridoxamine 5'-phosphate oxidase n=1 Tax=Legionella taurinensis TaxID=70611 RepID=A0AB38N467_9GAMM|nr:pyridoxamine 5'-phosphate oxidase family protein [Legionella taurinensis]MDX1837179.1 pyridoxamine 5'-phosphate oxidase family protein [Legionella taurinensis]PUT40345.1 pyridoxamine 5'-phosphate oxidase [Legionella taurinensis]PUT41580.1 pyridoxamine 5'-phosphate oxidase [Legionella taurinensis]PUT44445.1 pyridoxamine 5'-phosphate oxidase [Legionella taurinensis]PUT48407.1 pyridoxamine 5'-phosphate oxidase [Legionella taurinensis]
MSQVLSPIACLKQWLLAEKDAGAANPQHAVLSTVASVPHPVPHARVVALREISEDSLLFFTQRGTRKVNELTANPNAVLTFWFELHQRQISFEGEVQGLSAEETAWYWQNNAREAQLRFSSYAPTSGQPIPSKDVLEQKRERLTMELKDKPIPHSPLYCGFRFRPKTVYCYSYRTDELSDVSRFSYSEGAWIHQLLSP